MLLYMLIPKGLFPTQDTGQLQARVEAAQDVSRTRAWRNYSRQAAVRHPGRSGRGQRSARFVGVDAANNTMLTPAAC
ncbi:MAG: hypothetical protein QM765_11840 [Myxococcales bacterium]